MSRGTKIISVVLLSFIAGWLWVAHHVPDSNPSVIQIPLAPVPTEVKVSSPAPAISRAPVPQPVVATTGQQFALVLQKLQAWDDNDDEASRPQRLAELASLLNGTNMLEIVQQLPKQYMGYAFAVPGVREKLLADPPSSLAWMSAHPNVAGSQLSTFMHDWAQKNQDEMSAYLVTLPDGDWKQTVMATAAGQALSADPAYAIAYASRMNVGQSQNSLLQMAAANWSQQNPDAATQWAAQIQNPGLREQMIGAIAVGYADTDPMQSMQLAGQLSPGQTTDQTRADIAWKWAMQNPAGLADYLTQIPAGENWEPVLSNLINVWVNHHPEATVDWIESLPSGSLQLKAANEMKQVLTTE